MVNNSLQEYVAQMSTGIAEETALMKSSRPRQYLFDLVICDKQHKFKLALSPKLVHLVWDGRLIEGSWLRLESHSLTKRFRVIVGDAETFVYELCQSPEFLNESFNEFDPLSLAWLPNHDPMDSEFVPLTSARETYLSTYADGEPLLGDSRWLKSLELYPNNCPPHIPLVHTLLETMARTGSLGVRREAGAAKKFLSITSASDDILIGKIISKSNIIHYGEFSDMKQRYPFKFEFTIADRSGSIKCLVWNNLVLTYFMGLKVGQAVAIKGFRLKVPVQEDNDNAERYVAINPSSPAGNIYLLTSQSFQEWEPNAYFERFPDEASDRPIGPWIYDLKPGDRFIAIGRIQHVGEVINRVYTSTRFRFVHIVGRDNLRLIIRVGSHSQPKIFERLSIGMIFKSLVEYCCDETVDNPRFIYFKTTPESQLSLWNDNAMKINADLHQFTGIVSLGDIQTYTSETSCFLLPVVLNRFEDYFKKHLNPVNSISSVDEGLKFRQAKAVGESKRMCFLVKIDDHHTKVVDSSYFRVKNKKSKHLEEILYESLVEMLVLKDNSGDIEVSIQPNAAVIDIEAPFNYSDWLHQSLEFILPNYDESFENQTLNEIVHQHLLGDEYLVLVEFYRRNFGETTANVVKIFNVPAGFHPVASMLTT